LNLSNTQTPLQSLSLTQRILNQEKNFQQNIQLGILAGAGIVMSTVFGCMFAEWLQKFKVRKAKKALAARLNYETHQVRTGGYNN
jgi:hypothetical protein